jgi:hypothetical protein
MVEVAPHLSIRGEGVSPKLQSSSKSARITHSFHRRFQRPRICYASAHDIFAGPGNWRVGDTGFGYSDTM